MDTMGKKLRLIIHFYFIGCVASLCLETECESPPSQNGLTITEDRLCYASNENITYECTGTSFGPGDNFCDSGNWRYSHPVCQATLIECVVDILDNGGIIDDKGTYTLYDKLDYTCNSGYDLIGGETFVCDIDGAFKPTFKPLCAKAVVALPSSTTAPTPTEIHTTKVQTSTEETHTTNVQVPADVSPSGNWNGLIIGLSVGVGIGIILIIVTVIAAYHSRPKPEESNANVLNGAPDNIYDGIDDEMDNRGSASNDDNVEFATENKSFTHAL